jgi:hypothetical protein
MIRRAAALCVLLAGSGLARAQEDSDDDEGEVTAPALAPPPVVAPLVRPPPVLHEPNRALYELSVGGGARWLEEDGVVGVTVAGLVGRQIDSWGGGARLELTLGRTLPGLAYQSISVGPSFQFVAGRSLRLGFDLVWGLLFIQRVTTNDSFVSILFGGRLGGTVDLASVGDGHLYLGVRGGIDVLLPSSDMVSVVGSLALGYRL